MNIPADEQQNISNNTLRKLGHWSVPFHLGTKIHIKVLILNFKVGC